MPSQGHPNSQGGTLVHSPNPGAHGNIAPNSRLEEPDRGFERPPPRASTELFNPKGISLRPTSNNGKNISNTVGDRERTDRERERGEAVANAILTDRVLTMTLEDQEREGSPRVALSTS